jgi:hypothetical protein
MGVRENRDEDGGNGSVGVCKKMQETQQRNVELTACNLRGQLAQFLFAAINTEQLWVFQYP